MPTRIAAGLCLALGALAASAADDELVGRVRDGHRAARESIRTLTASVTFEFVHPTQKVLGRAKYWRSGDVARVQEGTEGVATEDSLSKGGEIRHLGRQWPKGKPIQGSAIRQPGTEFISRYDVWREMMIEMTGPLGRPASRTLRLYDNGDSTRKVREVRTLQPGRFSARLLPPVGDEPPHASAGRVIALVEIVPRTDKAGCLDGTIEVIQAGEPRPPDRVAVMGEVVSAVVVRPARLVLPRYSNGRPLWTGRVALTGRDRAVLSVVVESIPDGLTASIQSDPVNPGQWLVDASARSGGPATGTVAIRLRAEIRPGETVAVEVPITLSPVDP